MSDPSRGIPHPLVRRAFVLAVALLLATACSLASPLWWGFELMSHFALQLLLASGVIALVGLWFRAWRVLAISLLPLLFASWQVAPAFLAVDAEPGGPGIRLMTFNVNGGNRSFEAITGYIVASDCDLVLLLEVREGGMDAALSNIPGYRVVAMDPRFDNFGLALLSRLPDVEARLVRASTSGIAMLDAVVPWQGARWHLLGLHTWPPMRSDLADERNEALAFAATWAKQGGRRIVAGDLNITPYSPYFHALLRNGDLVDSRRGFGVQATWPHYGWYLAPARIPIDHVLHDRGLVTTARHTGPALGSDHLPVIVSLASAK